MLGSLFAINWNNDFQDKQGAGLPPLLCDALVIPGCG